MDGFVTIYALFCIGYLIYEYAKLSETKEKNEEYKNTSRITELEKQLADLNLELVKKREAYSSLQKENAAMQQRQEKTIAANIKGHRLCDLLDLVTANGSRVNRLRSGLVSRSRMQG